VLHAIGLVSMLTKNDEALLAEPDAILLREKVSEKINEFISWYTIPLFFFYGDDLSTPKKQGTGILFHLNRHGFVLTAGHCVRDYLDARACAVTITRQRHTFEAKFGRCPFVYRPETSIDIGVMEIPANKYESYRSYDRNYLEPHRILVHSSADLTRANDWMILGGYPSEIAKPEPGGAGMRLLTYSTTLAGLPPAPLSPLTPPEPSIQAIDLWVPARGLQAFPLHKSDVTLPLFGGASGAGCWKTGVRPEPAKFDADKPSLQLSAIHVGSTDPLPQFDHARFAREVLIGHHLRLLADTFPEVRSDVLRSWPSLADSGWALNNGS
jgi:hypothetical protein